jgi:uncharacterized SAM-binding protein YcdF (DUF218 family)
MGDRTLLYLFKNLVGDALMPDALGLLMLLIGVALLWIKRAPRFTRFLVTAATLFLTATGCEPIAKRLMSSLEDDFTPVQDTAPLRDIRWVVVLGGGHVADPALPPSTRLTPSALARLVEAIRIQRQLPGSRLLLSGYSAQVSHARVMAEAAVALGVDASMIDLEERTRDTEDEARLIAERLAGQRFVLVTSAVHMPRAASLFRKEGADFVPVPADYASHSNPNRPPHLLPSSTALNATERTFHEYLGLAWAALGGG